MFDHKQREFIFRDEWLGMWTVILLAPKSYYVYLFWVLLPAWLIAVYGISYPLYWLAEAEAGRHVPMGPFFRRWAAQARAQMQQPVTPPPPE